MNSHGKDSMPKPPRPDKEYFGKLDAMKTRKIAERRDETFDEAERKRLRELHWRKCAECGFEMESIAFKGSTILRCGNCGSAFLHADTLKALCGEESHIIESLLALFRIR